MTQFLNSIFMRTFFITIFCFSTLFAIFESIERPRNNFIDFPTVTQIKNLVDLAVNYAESVNHNQKKLEIFEKVTSFQTVSATFKKRPPKLSDIDIKETEFLSTSMSNLKKTLEAEGYTVNIFETRLPFFESKNIGGADQSIEVFNVLNMDSRTFQILNTENITDFPEGEADFLPLFETKTAIIQIQYGDERVLSLEIHHITDITSLYNLIFIIFVLVISALITSSLVHFYVSVPLSSSARQFDVCDDHAFIMPELGPTEIRRITRKMNIMKTNILKSISDQTTVLNAISHDLLGPIASIRIRAEFIKNPKLQKDILRSLANIENFSKAVLDSAKGGAVEEPFSDVDLASVVYSVIDDFDLDGKQVVANNLIDVVVKGRPNELKRVVQNLLSNSVQYADNISFHLSSQGDYAMLRLDDEGPGVPEDKLNDLTKPFRRIENSRNNQTGGYGLGLTIVSAIVRRHKGTLIFKNKTPKGFCVIVTFPINK